MYTPPPPPQQAPAYPPPPPPAYPGPAYPPPRYYPPRQQPPAWSGAPASPFYFAFGLGGAFPSGDMAAGTPVDQTFGSAVNLGFEGGLRMTPHLALGLYADLGVGDPGSDVRAYCNSVLASDCTSTTSRVGLLLRHTFEPSARVTPWVSVGTGFAHGTVSTSNDGYGSDNVFKASGWEMVRLMGGVDIRSNHVIGFGLYGGVGFTRYTHFENVDGTLDLGGRRTYPTVQIGLRFTLFP